MTMYPIINMSISNDSQNAITVTKKNEKECWIKFYNLESKKQIFEEKIGGGDTQYIKVKEVEQNAKATKFAIAYFDDGKFFLRTFGTIDGENRTEEEIEKNQVNINELLKIDDWTMAIDGFMDPYITCCFTSDSNLFVNLFHNNSFTNYHFIIDTNTNSIV